MSAGPGIVVLTLAGHSGRNAAFLGLVGFLGFALGPGAPWYQLAAIGFGIGVGLTGDEFALWVHLEDVYWSKEGRASLDAVILVCAFMALVVLGLRPFGLSHPLPVPVAVTVVWAIQRTDPWGLDARRSPACELSDHCPPRRFSSP